ncbi:hypothetical protein [Saccharothrix sp. ST-888]|uniref:hypothetical protein n=1 Tax=Saccharothrix sp. ST-888 TaxID=1427391 RepID=UPI0005EC701A|nr:hypothetical protein [Saccharothrix sp. ST-888]KJK59263.1 hypothetical protein UK12_05405 [Saccharothrix sp. ST-888]
MIASLDDVERLLRPAGYLGLAARPLYLLPLLRTGCLSELLTAERADLGWAERFGARMHSLEEQTARREDTFSGRHLEELMGLLPTLVGGRWRGREFGLTAYGTYREHWRQAIEQTGALLLVPPAPGGAELLTDKVLMRDWFEHLGVPAPASVVVDSIDYPVLSGKFGPTFVAQRPKSSGGNGTYLITGEQEAGELPRRNRWLVSEYAGDTTFSFHGFVPREGAPEVLRPAVQLTGLEGLGSGFGGYVGTDFHAPALLPAEALAKGREAMERIGHGLAELGYRGIFGGDFALRADGSVAALEINCRVLGSTWLLGELEFGAGRLPTMVRHFAERHGHSTLGKPDLDPVEAVQLTIRHTEPAGLLLDAPAGGVYALEGDRLVFRRPGAGLLECGPAQTQECVLVNLPRAGTLLHPGGILGRLVARRPLTTPDGRALNQYGQVLVSAMRGLYSFVDAAS